MASYGKTKARLTDVIEASKYNRAVSRVNKVLTEKAQREKDKRQARASEAASLTTGEKLRNPLTALSKSYSAPLSAPDKRYFADRFSGYTALVKRANKPVEKQAERERGWLEYDSVAGEANIEKLADVISRGSQLAEDIAARSKWIEDYENPKTPYPVKQNEAHYNKLKAEMPALQAELDAILAEYEGGKTYEQLQKELRDARVYHREATEYQTVNRLTREALEAEDFERYREIGANIANPSFEGANKGIEIFGWHPFGEEVGNPVTYSRENAGAIRFDGPKMFGVGDYLYQHMTDEEVGVYNYYLAKYGEEKANEYIEAIKQKLVGREAGNISNLYNDTAAEPFLNFVGTVERTGAGMTQGVRNAITGNESELIKHSPTSIASQIAMSDNEGIWKGVNDVSSSIGNMLPSILVGFVNPAAGAATMAVGVAGNAYDEMIRLGYSKNQARGYAALTAASEATLQYLLGGISKLGGKGASALSTKVLGKLDNAFAKLAIKHPRLFATIKTGTKIITNSASEATEEGLQAILEPLFKSWATNEAYLAPDFEEVAYNALLGALTAFALEGPSTIASDTVAYNQQKRFGKSLVETEQVGRLKELGKSMSADTAAYQLADFITEDTDAYSIAQYFKQVGAGLSEQNVADIAKGLERRGYRAEDAKVVADYINRAINGEELSSIQQDAIYEDEAAADVMREVFTNDKHTVNTRNAEYDAIALKASLETTRRAGAKAARKAKYMAAKTNVAVLNLVQKVKEKAHKANDKAYFENVSEENANIIKELTGVDVSGFKVAIEARQLEHIIKRHGENGLADHSMANANDIAKMQFVMSTPDSISNAGKTQAYTYMKNGRNKTADTVLYEKDIGDGSYYVVQAVPDTKAKTLYVVSAYIGKKNANNKGATQLIDAKSPNVTPENGSVNAPNPIIPQTTPIVKGADSATTIADFSKRYGGQAKAFVKTYELGGGKQDAATFAAQYDMVYSYGTGGVKPEYVNGERIRGLTNVLTNAQRELAYRAGRDVYDAKHAAEVKAGQKAIDEAVAKAKEKPAAKSQGKVTGKVHISKGVNARTTVQKQSLRGLEALARALGIDIYVYDSMKPQNADEKYSDGWYDEANNSIHIDIHAGRGAKGTMLYTVSHELAHFIKRWSPEKYDTFANFLVEQYGKNGKSIDELIDAQIKKAASYGDTMTRTKAFDEVVADSCERMLLDSNAMQKLSEFAARGEAERSIVKKIKNFFKKLLVDLREAYYGLDTNTEEAKLVSEMTDSLEQLYALFEDALVDAAEASRAVSEAGVEVESEADVKRSRKPTKAETDTRTFSYAELIAKDPLKGITIGKHEQIMLEPDGSIDADFITKAVKSKCEKIVTKAKEPTYVVEIPDIAEKVEIINKSITHGFIKKNANSAGKLSVRSEKNARIALELPAILNNSIEVNRSARADNLDVLYSHVLLGTVAVEDANGNIEYYAVRSVVEERKNQNPILVEANVIGKLKAHNAQKIGAAHVRVVNKTLPSQIAHTYEYSIADILDDVKGIFKNTFSNDVYAHFGMAREVDDFSKNLIHSRKNLDNGSDVGYNENIKDGENYAEEDEGYDSRRKGQRVRRNDEGPSLQNGNGSGVQEGNGRGGREQTKNSLPNGLSLEKQGKALRYSKESIIKPRRGSVEHIESQTLVKDYGIEAYVVKKDAWDRKHSAYAFKGVVYIREGATNDHLGVIAVHEATHIMKQLKYTPYLQFLEKTPDFFDIGTLDFRKMLSIVEKHIGADSIGEGLKNRDRLYDELNAAVYGSYMGDRAVGRVWNEFPDAFYDFDAYISELSAIHEQFKRDNTSKKRKDNDVYHSRKNPEDISTRALLADAMDSIAKNDDERARLAEYKAKIDEMEALEDRLYEVNAELKELSFSKGKRDTERVKRLTEEKRVLEAKVRTYDGILLRLENAAILREVINREKAKVKAKAEKRAKEAVKAQREKDEAKYKAKLADYQARRRASEAKMRERRDESALRNRIKGVKSKLEKMLLSPTESQYVPQGLADAIIDVCGLINTDTDALKKDGSVNKAQLERERTKAALQALKDEYEKLRDTEDTMYQGEFDDYIYESIGELRDSFGGKALSEMGLAELEEMHDILIVITDTLADAKKLIGYGEAVTAREFGDGIIDEQRAVASKRKNGSRNAAQRGAEHINMLSLSPVRAVERMSGYKSDSYLLELFHELNKGVRKKNAFVMDSYSMFEALTTGENKQKYEDAIYKPGDKLYTDKWGKKFKITDMQKMQAILTYEREAASNFKTRHVEGGGLRFADFDLLRKGRVQDAVGDEFAHHVLGADAVKLIESFKLELSRDEWAQAYMAAAREYFNGMAKDAINETTLTLKHRIVAREAAYIPFVVASSFTAREITDIDAMQKTVASFGMLKDVQVNAKNPLVMSGLNNILDRHIDEVGSVYGLAIPVRNFNKVWRVQSADEGTSVQESIGRNWGKDGQKLIEQAVKDVQGSRVDTQGQLYKKIKSNVISSTFAFNLSVVTKQIGSLYSATSMLKFRDPATMLSNLVYTMAHIDQIAAEVNKYTASTWMRAQGLSDAELRTLATQAQKGAISKLFDKLPAGFNPQKWITAMDYSVALSLWKYAKEDVAARTGLEGEALLKATAEFYDDVIENTQSMSDVLHRPEIQKSKNVLAETFSMFKTDLYQMAGQLQTAAGRYMADKNAENKAVLGKTVYSVAMSALWGQAMTALFAAIRYSVKRYRDDEDELTAESWFKRIGFALLGDFAGYIVPLVGSEIVGLVETVYYGESDELVDNLALDAINDVAAAVLKIANAAKDGEMLSLDETRKISENVFALFGLPMKNIVRIVNAVQLHARDIANGEFLSFNSDPSLPKGKQIYIAASRGDEGALDKLRATYKTDDTFETAVRKALRENDERIREAAEARIDGDFGEYDRIVREIEREGNFDTELISEAVFAEENAIRKANGEEEVGVPSTDDDDVAHSIYKADDIGRLLDKGDTAYAKRVVNELIEVKIKNGSTEKDAKSSIKSSLTRYYKEKYIAANETERKRIRMAMWATGLYAKSSDLMSLVNGWIKNK